MSEREPLFRQEALEYQRRRAAPADLVRLASWPKKGFWLVLLLIAGVVVAGSVTRVERVALALALVEDGRVTALLPEGQGAPPEAGSEAAYLPVNGGREVAVRIESVEESVPADEARDLFPGLALAINGPVTVLRTSEVDTAEDFGQLRVRTGSEPVIVAFVPGLREIFGES
ncbi:MAG TPA: hypothetical protein VG318_17515 [Actinomycetota bacterium]|nr:hypothetical protein [Actinomycetota bacterium]